MLGWQTARFHDVPRRCPRRGAPYHTRWALALLATFTANIVSRTVDAQNTSPPSPSPAAASATPPGDCSCEACQNAAESASGGDSCPKCGRKHGPVDWKKVPGSIRAIPRTGNFPIAPTGPGYYTLVDRLSDNCRKKQIPSGYPAFALMPPSFFDADFRYVESLDPAKRTLVEDLKRIHVGDNFLFSTGGNAWARFMNEWNSRLTEADNSYTLARVRAFGDLSYRDRVRVFGEFIWADSFSEELNPAAIDVNRGDILNLFADFNLFDYNGKPVYARLGRQELVLGSQRLISGLDWANTRRTFDGVRFFRRGEKWDFDAFWTQLVPPDPSGFDQHDQNQDFAGAWLTYRPKPGHFVDFYQLYYDNSNAVSQQQIVRAPTQVNTSGARYVGDREGFLWDGEVALQYGNQNSERLFAGMATAGLGRSLKDAPWKPTAWVYYDYASGDASPGAGHAHTFNQLFPFGHYYLGWIDLVGRQNIQDANAHLYLYPSNWVTVWLQYHHFWLNHSQDALYNAGGAAIRRDPTGQAGNNVGDEIDIVLNFHVTRNSDLLTGYSHLYGGSFLENTRGPNRAADASLYYLMYQLKW